MITELLSYVKEGDNILIKASHFMDFPKVVEALTSIKGEADINLDISQNLQGEVSRFKNI